MARLQETWGTFVTALEAKELSVKLGQQQILHNISARFCAGQIVGILGPNGAGKSTLIKTLAGLLTADSGKILIDDSPTENMSRIERAKRIAYVPQEREATWSLSTEAIVALGRQPYRSAFAAVSEQDQTAIDQAIIDADITGLRHRRVNDLSGGERARVLFARALAQEADILLADEPTSGLDPAHQLAMLQLLKDKAATGKAIVLSLHELHLASRWCNRLILLHNGDVISVGTPKEVLTRKNVLTVYGCDAQVVETRDGPVLIPIPVTSKGDQLDAHPNFY